MVHRPDKCLIRDIQRSMDVVVVPSLLALASGLAIICNLHMSAAVMVAENAFFYQKICIWVQFHAVVNIGEWFLAIYARFETATVKSFIPVSTKCCQHASIVALSSVSLHFADWMRSFFGVIHHWLSITTYAMWALISSGLDTILTLHLFIASRTAGRLFSTLSCLAVGVSSTKLVIASLTLDRMTVAALRAMIQLFVGDATGLWSKVSGYSSKTKASATASIAFSRSSSMLVGAMALSCVWDSLRTACRFSALVRWLRRRGRMPSSVPKTVPARHIRLISVLDILEVGYRISLNVEYCELYRRRNAYFGFPCWLRNVLGLKTNGEERVAVL